MVHSLAGERTSRNHKRLLTLQAEFARRGFALDPLTEDSVLLQRWGLSRVFHGLDAAQRFLDQLGRAA